MGHYSTVVVFVRVFVIFFVYCKLQIERKYHLVVLVVSFQLFLAHEQHSIVQVEILWLVNFVNSNVHDSPFSLQ